MIRDSLPRVDHWCVGGDFNIADRCGGSTTTIHGAELAAWDELGFAQRLSDAWHVDTLDRAVGASHSHALIGGWVAPICLALMDGMWMSGLAAAEGGQLGFLLVLSSHIMLE